ncbi:MAG TPA: DNA primase [Acidisphaera sp.]|nr:DNA primase [Acidisphaera sp.]
MPLPAGFLDELRARTPLPALIGRRVKLARSGRQWKGCCPFHNEKTPSFYVYDDHYHCFGCGKHGDAVTFVMESEGATFPDAVAMLAAEAGLEVPKPSPEAAEADRHRATLADVLEAASRSYQRRLFLPEGRAALDYLRGRGLSEETIRRFGLGWSGEGRGALAAELARDGIEAPLLAEAGLMRLAEDDRPAADLFFNRVMFPIRDRRGRIVSFGGRTLGDGQPKYVNGPETPLFSKRRTLYGLDLATAGVRVGATLVAVEGYMDVIALHQAGLAGAVAPLGTALTEEQLDALWRLSPAPVLCFDGDDAGRRAAHRAAMVALPHLAPDRTLKFVALPEKQDPDSLVRSEGPGKFKERLEAPQSLADALYGFLSEAVGKTPEAQAAFHQRLKDAARQIPDRALASEYRRVLLDRFFASRRRTFAPPPVRVTRPTASAGDAAAERVRVLTAILLRHPDLLHDVDHAYRDIAMPAALDQLRHALIDTIHAQQVLDSPSLLDHLAGLGLTGAVHLALSDTPLPLPRCAAPDAMPADAEDGWWHFFGLLDPRRLDAEIAEAQRRMAEEPDETNQRRLVALVRAQKKLMREPGEAEA